MYISGFAVYGSEPVEFGLWLVVAQCARAVKRAKRITTMGMIERSKPHDAFFLLIISFLLLTDEV
jgi:hypothetical protein